MNTTAFGLVVAIPLMLIYTFLQAWTNRLIDRLDEYALKLTNLSGTLLQGVHSNSVAAKNGAVEYKETLHWRAGGMQAPKGKADAE